MPAQEAKHRGRKLLAVTVLALLALLSAVNFRIVKTPLARLVRHEIGFTEFVNEVQNGYISGGFAGKNGFVNLNGLFARLTGRRTLNEVVRLSNGMLCVPAGNMDITPLAGEIAGFSDYLRERDIPFLYVQLPYKEPLDGQVFPAGVTSYRNSNADRLLSRLSAAEVETLDLRPLVNRTPEMLERYFYKTDHHWNGDGAFAAFQEILSRLHESFPDGKIDLTCARADQWERHSIDDWFLGAWGKRVGTFFGGTDPLIWYTPRFETEMSCAVPVHGWLYRGDFADANIRAQYIEKKDYFGYNAYEVYIGGEYPLVQHRNLDAPSPLKVLWLKDSFTLPLQAFFSTVFQEIDVIDPRYFSECTIAEYVERAQPDIVVLAMNPSPQGSAPDDDFGVEEAAAMRAEAGPYVPVFRQDVTAAANDSDYNYAALPLEPNTVYRITFEGVDIFEGETEGVGLRLYDKTAETVLGSMIFDLAYCEAADGFSWVFRTPGTQDELQLLFYAGLYGSTAGNSVIYRDVTVEKCTADAGKGKAP